MAKFSKSRWKTQSHDGAVERAVQAYADSFGLLRTSIHKDTEKAIAAALEAAAPPLPTAGGETSPTDVESAVERANRAVQAAGKNSHLNFPAADLRTILAALEERGKALEKIGRYEDHFVVKGSPGPLYTAGWNGGCRHAGEIARKALGDPK